MRRIVKSLAIIGLLALGGCSGGGSVLNFGSSADPEHVILTVQGPTNLARVLPGAGLPISAVAVKGGQNGFLNINRFRWSAALTTGQFYNFTSDGNAQKPCANVLLTQSGTATPLTADFGIYIAIDPVNEANIEFIPPTTIPVPATATPGSVITTNFPYCVIVNAQALSQAGASVGPPGSILVVVVSPQNPLG
jgi:hypothetical protein